MSKNWKCMIYNGILKETTNNLWWFQIFWEGEFMYKSQINDRSWVYTDWITNVHQKSVLGIVYVYLLF